MEDQDKKKKTFSERFADYFMSIDMKSILKHEFEQTLLPHIIDTLVDSVKAAFSNTVDELAYHGKKDEARARRSSGHMPYNSFFDGGSKPLERRNIRRIGSPNYVVEDIQFKTQEEAYEVLKYLDDMLNDDRYDFVTVLNLYNAAHMPTTSTMDDYGWTDISRAVVLKNERGWILRMPRPQRI